MEKGKNGKRGKKLINCEKCGNEMKSVFTDMERTYIIMACTSCDNQVKQFAKDL